MSRIKKPISQHQGSQISIIGKIKVGMKKPGSNYPTSLDYFRFTSPTKNYVDRAEAMYGQPNTLRVTFMTNDDNNNCCQRYELRDNGGRLIAYTDLEEMMVSRPKGFEAVGKERIELGGGIEKAMEAMEQKYSGVFNGKEYKAKFIEILYLRVVLVDFPVLGQWEIYTKGSKSTIKNIIGTYDSTKQFAGRVRGIPFNLTVTKVKSNRHLGTTSGGKPIVRYYPVISLHPDLGVKAQEQVRQLGEQVQGFISQAKIQQLAIEAPKTHNNPKAKIYTEYEDVTTG